MTNMKSGRCVSRKTLGLSLKRMFNGMPRDLRICFRIIYRTNLGVLIAFLPQLYSQHSEKWLQLDARIFSYPSGSPNFL